MSEYKLSKECALPWNLDVRSKTYMAIRNANNNPTGLVLMCMGTPSQKAAADYAVACANLMPEAVEIIKLACFSPCRDLCKHAKNGEPSIEVPECDFCPEGAYYARAKAFLEKLEGGADDATNP